jgi:four helix bundle protein
MATTAEALPSRRQQNDGTGNKTVPRLAREQRICRTMPSARNLRVLDRAFSFSIAVHTATARAPTGGAHLVESLRRDAARIGEHITDGASMASDRQFAESLTRAIAAAFDTERLLSHAHDRRVLGDAAIGLSAEVVEIRRMLYGLRRIVTARTAPDPRRAS